MAPEKSSRESQLWHDFCKDSKPYPLANVIYTKTPWMLQVPWQVWALGAGAMVVVLIIF
jgi:hypothetical protein